MLLQERGYCNGNMCGGWRGEKGGERVVGTVGGVLETVRGA